MPIDLKSDQDGYKLCHFPGMDREMFSKDQFRRILSEVGNHKSWPIPYAYIAIQACQKMNIPSSEELSLEGMQSFSHDVLKIELSGPDYEHFSVVDLPGLFRSMFSPRVWSEYPNINM